MAASSEESPGGYDALTSDAAVYRDAERRVVRVEGDRAPAMLQGLVTADISTPGDGSAWPSLVLSPKGRVLADAIVVRTGETMLLDVPEAAWAELETHFGRYLPPRFADLRPSGLGVFRLRGPRALEAATAIDLRLGKLEAPERTPDVGVRRRALALDAGVASRPGAVCRVGSDSGEGLDFYLAPDAELAARLGELTPVSQAAWEAWRIERGDPVYGRDVTAENLPQETGLVADSTSFRKGCYTGQEVLARIHYRGKVNRRLVGLRPVNGATPGESETRLEAGQALRSDEREVGVVTSAAYSPRLGWIGLGYARREIDPGDVVTLGPAAADAPGGGPAVSDAADAPGGGAARVVELPFVEHG